MFYLILVSNSMGSFFSVWIVQKRLLFFTMTLLRLNGHYMQFYTEDEVNLLVYNNGSPVSHKDPYIPMKSNL
jgi:hypothetical protein